MNDHITYIPIPGSDEINMEIELDLWNPFAGITDEKERKEMDLLRGWTYQQKHNYLEKWDKEDLIKCLIGHADFHIEQRCPRIKKVIFNDPATVVFWEDGSKTVVKRGEHDIIDPEKGLAMAISKRVFGNNGSYYKVFKKWLPEEYQETVPLVIDIDPGSALSKAVNSAIDAIVNKMGAIKEQLKGENDSESNA